MVNYDDIDYFKRPKKNSIFGFLPSENHVVDPACDYGLTSRVNHCQLEVLHPFGICISIGTYYVMQFAL